jgi:chemotaxis signal transduction protein
MNKVSAELNIPMVQAPSPTPEEGQERLIIFRLQREWLALRVEEIREVVRRTPITRVPNSPPTILGIMNLRGRLLAVFDLDALLDFPKGAEKDRPQVIILNLPDPEMDLGFLVDEVAQIREISANHLREPSAPALGERKGAFFRGTLYYGGLLVNVLNPSPIVSSLVPELEEASG